MLNLDLNYAPALGLLVGALVAGCAGADHHPAVGAGTSATVAAHTTVTHRRRRAPVTHPTAPVRSRRRRVRPAHEPERAPGSMPQTRALPHAHSAVFGAEIDALWRAVRAGSVRLGLPAFFPDAAYAQVKAIANPHADWVDRLVSEYALDIGAAHALLGAHARSATLVAVHVATAYAHWVPPGACFNRVGYFEVPNARLLYRVGGRLHSFGIASMISWRGVWYVVHLGAVVRAGPGGIVDDPSSGPGVSTPSSTC